MARGSSSFPDQAGMEMQEHPTHPRTQRRSYDYGGNPLARERTKDSNFSYAPAFGGAFQPSAYKIDPNQKIANPA